jgi:hypothetical protein
VTRGGSLLSEVASSSELQSKALVSLLAFSDLDDLHGAWCPSLLFPLPSELVELAPLPLTTTGVFYAQEITIQWTIVNI